MPTFDPNSFRKQFPLIKQGAERDGLIYFDNAATTQKPDCVLQAVERYYRETNANVHRAAHRLSDNATRYYENARDTAQQFLNARHRAEIIWTRGTTEGINLLANCLPLLPGDEILISALEHHANIVPWQLAAQRGGACIKVIPLNSQGDLDLEAYQQLLNSRTRLVAVTQCSNAIGSQPDLPAMIELAHNAGALFLVDGAQSIAHHRIDLQQMGCDFFVCSGHKAFAPTGIGLLFGKRSIMETLPPWQGGGEMIEHVSFERSIYQPPPLRFEAGTPNISGAIGFAAALDMLGQLDRKQLIAHEQQLLSHAKERCLAIPGVRLVVNPEMQGPVLSLQVPTMDHKDISAQLDQAGIAVRTGHHCAMPLMQLLGLKGTIRISFSAYNQLAEVDRFADNLEQILSQERAALAVTRPTNHQQSFDQYGKSLSFEQVIKPLLATPQWQQRYRKIMQLGDNLPSLPDNFRGPENLVSGCESPVWLHSQIIDQGKDARLELMADSESRLLRGLLSLLLCLANHRPIKELQTFDPMPDFEPLGLERHLSPSRSNGLHRIIEQIRRRATHY
ncbi:SufS family cysteine desulfurase [Aestuariirhabdus sp. Z084]|uniref:SufS family cysteine desulfurase n=1 Tax=Aestuariirhabdus haliotis TaxID=2918751 RepID=UPI00201B3AE5|nr:SufS family cysteine desulfurase [Aestuariirhabdus haliotis]MCL6414861.1 SufS family cysteine desulfurase [Aestuariirhabdus haliotis]MCL6418793.1 SufS family cysteine desulfurase [Aestuariirhabdus haliotis]